jgi:hypothetical protein
MARLKFRVYDYSDEVSVVNWEVDPAITVPDAQAFMSTIAALTRGTLGEQQIIEEVLVAAGSTARPVSADAQREDKWVIEYLDTVNGKTYRLSLPTAQRQLLPGGSEVLPSTAVEYTDFETQFNQRVLSPYGNPVNLVGIRYVAVAI